MAHLDVFASLDLARVPAVLGYNLLLVWHVLYPVNVFGSASAHLPLDGIRGQAGEYEHGGPSARCVVYCSSEALCSNIDVYDNSLRFAAQSRVAVGH